MSIVTAAFPRYQCHKIVRAVKIKRIEPQCMLAIATHGVLVRPVDDEGVGSFIVPEDFITRHAPQPGGYIVAYEDGYISYSPAEAFESGYTRL